GDVAAGGHRDPPAQAGQSGRVVGRDLREQGGRQAACGGGGSRGGSRGRGGGRRGRRVRRRRHGAGRRRGSPVGGGAGVPDRGLQVRLQLRVAGRHEGGAVALVQLAVHRALVLDAGPADGRVGVGGDVAAGGHG